MAFSIALSTDLRKLPIGPVIVLVLQRPDMEAVVGVIARLPRTVGVKYKFGPRSYPRLYKRLCLGEGALSKTQVVKMNGWYLLDPAVP